MDSFSISSSTSSEKFLFSERDGELFTFEVAAADIQARRKVSTYTDDMGIANLFAEVSNLNRPWEDRKTWRSLEGEFELILTCNSTGNVTMQVKLSNWCGGNEDWHLVVHLCSELGQLKQLANAARAFFCA